MNFTQAKTSSTRERNDRSAHVPPSCPPARLVHPVKSAIFVVDDDAPLCASIRRVLERAGYAVTVETSSERAVRTLLSDAEFDLTLLDLVMPGLDGSKVIDILTARASARLSRTVVLTGNADLAPDWLKRSRLEVLEKPAAAHEIEGVAARYSAMHLSRGPMPLRTPSRPDLHALVDEPEEINTGVFNSIMAQASAPSRARPKSDPPGLHEVIATGFRFMERGLGEVRLEIKETRADHAATSAKLDALAERVAPAVTIAAAGSRVVKTGREWAWIFARKFAVILAAAAAGALAHHLGWIGHK